MKNLVNLFFAFILILASSNAFALQSVICTPALNPQVSVTITFSRNIDPKKPFIGTYEWGARLNIQHPVTSKSYENRDVRMTPEVYTTDITLRGDAEGVSLRLYPHFDSENTFVKYTGQLFVNDLDRKAYFNFTDRNGVAGLDCL